MDKLSHQKTLVVCWQHFLILSNNRTIFDIWVTRLLWRERACVSSEAFNPWILDPRNMFHISFFSSLHSFMQFVANFCWTDGTGAIYWWRHQSNQFLVHVSCKLCNVCVISDCVVRFMIKAGWVHASRQLHKRWAATFPWAHIIHAGLGIANRVLAVRCC